MKVGNNGESVVRESLLLFFVLAIALAVRLAFLDRVPTNVMPDEADNLVDAYHILAGTGPDLIGLDWTQLPALNAHLMALFLRVSDHSVVGMRMAAVVTSTLALLMFHGLIRRIVEPVPALLSTLLLATGLWYLNFSRTAWSNVYVVLFGLLAIYFLVQALERQKWYLYILAGGGIALTLYGYYAGRATVVALIIYLPIGLYLYRARWRSILAGCTLMLAVAALLFQPQWQLFQEDWEYTNRRVESVSIFHQKEPYLGETDPSKLLKLQTERMLRAFLLLDGAMFQTPRYTPSDSPPIDYVTGGLYLAGLLVGLMRLRHTALWYLCLFVPLFLTQVLSIHTPDTGRAIVVAPAIYLFVALALQAYWQAVGSWKLRLLPVGLVIAVSVFNLWWYYDWALRPETALVRQPAVEYSEFERWQQLQMERAVKGERGFTVNEWHQMRQVSPNR